MSSLVIILCFIATAFFFLTEPDITPRQYAIGGWTVIGMAVATGLGRQ